MRWLTLALTLVALSPLSVRGEDPKMPAGIVVDKEKRTVTIDAKVAPRKLANLDAEYPIEVVACWAAPKGRKAHETIVTIDVKPSDVHKAVESLGLKPGTPVEGEGEPKGPVLNVFLELPTDAGPKKVGIDKVLIDPKTNKNMPKVKWRFTGSAMSKVAPDKDETVYGADVTGTLIALFPVTKETVFQTNLTLKEEKYLKLDTDRKVLPKEGTAVKLILEAPAK
jgi:hypothetical protein